FGRLILSPVRTPDDEWNESSVPAHASRTVAVSTACRDVRADASRTRIGSRPGEHSGTRSRFARGSRRRGPVAARLLRAFRLTVHGRFRPRSRALGVNIDSLARYLAREALAHPGVAAAYTPRTLAAAAASDTNALRWRHAIPATVPWLICAVAKPGYIWSTGRQIAEHGTMNE